MRNHEFIVHWVHKNNPCIASLKDILTSYENKKNHVMPYTTLNKATHNISTLNIKAERKYSPLPCHEYMFNHLLKSIPPYRGYIAIFRVIDLTSRFYTL